MPGRVALTPSSGLALVTLPPIECNSDGIDFQRHITPPRTSTDALPRPLTGQKVQRPQIEGTFICSGSSIAIASLMMYDSA